MRDEVVEEGEKLVILEAAEQLFPDFGVGCVDLLVDGCDDCFERKRYVLLLLAHYDFNWH
jgi:hypothetical protein